MTLLEELIEEVRQTQLALSDVGVGMSIELVIRPVPVDLSARPVQQQFAYVLVGQSRGRTYQSCLLTTKDHQAEAVTRMREAVRSWVKIARSSRVDPSSQHIAHCRVEEMTCGWCGSSVSVTGPIVRTDPSQCPVVRSAVEWSKWYGRELFEIEDGTPVMLAVLAMYALKETPAGLQSLCEEGKVKAYVTDHGTVVYSRTEVETLASSSER